MYSLTLQNAGGDNVITAGDIIGRINYAVPAESDGAAATYIVGSMNSVAEGAFTSSSNPAALVFSTSAADAAAAVERVRIDKDGKMGIGTSSPLFKLDVNGDFSADEINVNGQYTFPTGVGNVGDSLVYSGSNQVAWSGVSGGGGITGTGASNYAARWTSSTVLGTGIIYDNGSNVGIGTSSPSQKLEVNGIIKSSSLEASSLAFGSTDTIAGGSNITLTSVLNNIILTTFNAAADHIHCTNTTYASRPSVDINPDAGNIDFTVFHDTSTSVPLFHCDADLEKVGIGTITPSEKLHVSGGDVLVDGGRPVTISAGNNIATSKKASAGGWEFSHDAIGSSGTNSGGYGWYGTNDVLSRYWIGPAYDTASFNILYSNGNVGINVLNPAAPLHVKHDNNVVGIRVEDTTTGNALEIGESAYTASNLYTGITHSEYTGSQEYMLLSAGSHTFVSAKTNYHTYIRGGGNSTPYQAIVKDSSFSIGSYTYNIGANRANKLIVDAEGLMANKNIYIDRYLESNIAVGWYTVAVNISNRACGRFGLACQSSGRHQGIIFYASHYFGAGNQISILHNEKYSSSNPIAKIRIKEGGTYDGCLLQVYIDATNSNSPEIFLLGDNINDSGWVVVDWVPDGTDPVDDSDPPNSLVANFSSLTNVAVEVDLDTVEFGTTGNSEFQGTVICDSSVTASSLIKSGGTSSQFLKADGSVDTSTYLTSVAFSDIAAAAIVTEAEGISSNDNDTTIPTSAAVKDYVDNNGGGSSNLIRGSFAVTSSTTVFTVSGGYDTNTLDVYQNGVKLFKGSSYDFTETGGGTTFTLANAATNGDLVEYVALNASTSATGNTSLGSVSVTSNQTVFNTSDTFTSSNLAVFLNGVKLVDGTDYNVTSSSQFTLTSTAVSGDVVEYIAYGATVASSNLAKTGDTMTGNLTVNADLVVTGYKETHTDNGNTGSAQTISITSSTLQTYTLTGNCTFTMPATEAGRSFTMLLKTGAGSFTATFTGVKFPDNVAPTISTAANRMDILTFYCDGTNWYGSAQQEYHV